MTNKKQLSDFKSEEEFLHYLSGEIEDLMMNANDEIQKKLGNDNAIMNYEEFFLANEPEEDITIYKDLLYNLANKYLGYDLK